MIKSCILTVQSVSMQGSVNSVKVPVTDTSAESRAFVKSTLLAHPTGAVLRFANLSGIGAGRPCA